MARVRVCGRQYPSGKDIATKLRDPFCYVRFSGRKVSRQVPRCKRSVEQPVKEIGTRSRQVDRAGIFLSLLGVAPKTGSRPLYRRIRNFWVGCDQARRFSVCALRKMHWIFVNWERARGTRLGEREIKKGEKEERREDIYIFIYLLIVRSGKTPLKCIINLTLNEYRMIKY